MEHREDREKKQLILMAIKSGRGQGTNGLSIPPSQHQPNGGMTRETWCIRTSTGAYGSRLVPSGRATFNCGHAALG